jgi:hypothetical protein
MAQASAGIASAAALKGGSASTSAALTARRAQSYIEWYFER